MFQRSGRRDEGNHLALVSAVDVEVSVHRDHAVLRMQFAHPDQAKVGEVGVAVAITLREGGELRQMIGEIEPEPDQTFFNHFEEDTGIAE